MSHRARPTYCPGYGRKPGVVLRSALTLPDQPALGFTCVRCCGSSRASIPHGLAAKIPVHWSILSCSCIRLAVASVRPRRGLSPPITHPCPTHSAQRLRRFAPPAELTVYPQWGVLVVVGGEKQLTLDSCFGDTVSSPHYA